MKERAIASESDPSVSFLCLADGYSPDQTNLPWAARCRKLRQNSSYSWNQRSVAMNSNTQLGDVSTVAERESGGGDSG